MRNNNNQDNTAKARLWKCGWIVCLLSLCLLTVLAGCSSGLDSLWDNDSADSENVEKEEKLYFDLSEYDNHGRVSCGLIWVEKTVSSYDTEPETCFAYLDVYGAVKSEWFSSEEWEPADFSNGLVVLRSRYGGRGTPTKEYCAVLDTSFRVIFDEYVVTNREVGMNAYEWEEVISDADENGKVYAVCRPYGEDDRLYAIDADGVITFDISENNLSFASVKNLKRIRMESGYYIIDIREPIANYPSYLAIHYESGALAIEPSKATGYTVFSVEILSDHELKILFLGKDDVMYFANIDFAGNFLTEPVTA